MSSKPQRGLVRNPNHGPSRQIPEWDLAEASDAVTVRCTTCDGSFTISTEWVEQFKSRTRPCPWCFKVSVIPPHPAYKEE